MPSLHGMKTGASVEPTLVPFEHVGTSHRGIISLTYGPTVWEITEAARQMLPLCNRIVGDGRDTLERHMMRAVVRAPAARMAGEAFGGKCLVAVCCTEISS